MALGFRIAHAERNTHRCGYSDRGRTTDDHVADRSSNLGVSATGNVDLFSRQARLVDETHAGVGPLEGFNHASDSKGFRLSGCGLLRNVRGSHVYRLENRDKLNSRCGLFYCRTSAGFFAFNKTRHSDDIESELARSFDGLNR